MPVRTSTPTFAWKASASFFARERLDVAVAALVSTVHDPARRIEIWKSLSPRWVRARRL
jgi:hypothetical protein